MSIRFLVLGLAAVCTLAFILGATALRHESTIALINAVTALLQLSLYQSVLLATFISIVTYTQFLTHRLPTTTDLKITACIAVVLNYCVGIMYMVAYTHGWWELYIFHLVLAVFVAVSLPRLVQPAN